MKYKLTIFGRDYGNHVEAESIANFEIRNDNALREIAQGLIHDRYTIMIQPMPENGYMEAEVAAQPDIVAEPSNMEAPVNSGR